MADAQEWARDKVEFRNQNGNPNQPGISPGPLAATFADLTRALLDATTVADVLDQIVHAAARLIPDADLVSITLRSRDGAFHTPVCTDSVAAELDQIQYQTGEGPCIDAASMSGPGHVRSDDLAHEAAWPRFGPQAAERGFTAVLSTTLLPEVRLPRLSGALNLYAHRPRVLPPHTRDTALLLATHASLAIVGTEVVHIAALREAQLREAIESRDVIGQAKGILMSRRGVSADAAFELLRRTSQELNVRLAELAATLAAHHAELDSPNL